MATYILLLNWTDKGAQAAKDAPQRAAAARKAAQDMGGDLKATYMVMGQYDFVAILELPDDEAAAKFAIRTSQQGFVQTETLRAFSEAEYAQLLASLP
jgi:uncharacterized protein with GYD domain